MQGDIGRIPIITLSGCKPLTNILAELPVPQSTHVSIGCRTLLYEPKLVHDAYRCINGEDKTLATLLTSSLRAVNTDTLTFREISPNRSEKPKSFPVLLKSLLDVNAFSAGWDPSEPTGNVSTGRLQLPESSLPAVGERSPAIPSPVVEKSRKPSPKMVDTKDAYSAVRIAPLRISLKKTSLHSDDTTKVKARKSKRIKTRPHTTETSSPGRENNTSQLANSSVLSATTTVPAQSEVVQSKCNPTPHCPPPGPLVIGSSDAACDNVSNNGLLPTGELPQKCCHSIADTATLNPITCITTSPASCAVSECSGATLAKCATSATQELSLTNGTVLSAVASVSSATTISPALSSSTLPVPTTDTSTLRRVPDPALSHLFQSAALFHPFQPQCEHEKADSTVGGGLFDDWTDSSIKVNDLTHYTINPPPSVDGAYSGSISGPSSVVGNPLHGIQAPHSVGGGGDVSSCIPPSPQSVLSNYSSYPATPGGGLPSISTIQTTHVSSVVASPSTLMKCNSTKSTLPSPSIRLFDTMESRTEVQESSLEEQPRIAPHGLAAYLPRSSSMRQQTATEDDLAARLLSEDPRSTSPQVPSPNLDYCGPHSASASDSGSRPQSTGKTVPRSTTDAFDNGGRYSNGTTPQKSGNRGRFSGGKPRGSGRRRRTELEELCNWNVNDRSQPVAAFKISSLPTAPDEHQTLEPNELVVGVQSPPNIPPGALSSADSSVAPSSESRSNRQSPANHGIFTEALVERVKRRRQLESQKRQSHQPESVLTRSHEGSPASISPVRSSSKSSQDPGRSHISKHSGILCDDSTNRLIANQQSHEGDSSSDICRTGYTVQRSRSFGSDSSISPSSTPLSSVRSFKREGSVSSCSGSIPPPKLDQQSKSSDSSHPRSCSKVELHCGPTDPCDTQNHESRDSQNTAVADALNYRSGNYKTRGNHRRKVITSDEEEPKRSPLLEENPRLQLPPKLEELQVHHVQPIRTTSGPSSTPKLSQPSASPNPPTLLPLNSPSLSTNPWATRDFSSPQRHGHHSTERLADSDRTASNKPLMDERASNQLSPSPVKKQGRGRPRKRLETETIDHSRNTSDEDLSNLVLCDQNHKRQTNPVPVKSTSNQSEVGTNASVTNTEVPPNDLNATDSEDSNSSLSDEQSTSSISSIYSPPEPCARDLSYTNDQRCLTPSTLPYTHSSAMEDSDPGESACIPSGTGTHPGPDNAQNDVPSSPEHSSDLDSVCSGMSLDSKLAQLSPLSPLSSTCEDADEGSADNCSDTEQSRNEDLAAAASVLTQFTARLGKILRRVEELDLLKLASDISMRKPTVTADGDDFDNEVKCFDLVPDAARLSRHELSALYTESAQVRLAGSMYTIPTGRLVRFLTLVLVNMQAGAHASLAPLTSDDVIQFLEGRNKQRYEGSRKLPTDQISESLLWSNPEWASVLIGLDSARIALNIIAAPDMPRPLLMEDLVDGIVSVVKHVLDGAVCKVTAPASMTRQNDRMSGTSMKSLWNFAVECVGYRVSQILAVLSCLVRFQPVRFTDNLVIRLTGLSLTVPLHCLKTGQSIDRDPKRLSAPIFKRMLAAAAADSKSSKRNTNSPTVGASRLWLLIWPSHLQRASLGLLSGVYSQYESHCKLIVDEIFSTFLSISPLPSNGNVKENVDNTRLPTGNDRATARTFRLLSSKWFFLASKHSKNSDKASAAAATNGRVESFASDQKFLRVHALTALFLSLTQSLIQAPGSPLTSSTGGGGGAAAAAGGSNASAARRHSASSSSDLQVTGEHSQFCKDEKQVLLSYNTCMRHAQYLFSGLLKRVCSRSELDLRPVLETVTCDLLTVATSALLEWPVAPTLISVLSSLLVQYLGPNGSNNTSASTSRNSDLTSKLTYLDTLTTLAIGLKRNFPTSSSFNIGHSHKEGLPENHVDGNSVTQELDARIADAVAQTQLVGFLSSPISVMHHWLLEPGVTPSTLDGVVGVTGAQLRQLDYEIMKWIRLEYADYLILTAQRFHLASWLSECTRELGDVANSAVKAPSDLVSSRSKNVRELEQLRHQLLSELAMTHHTAPNSIPWLIGSRQSAGAVVGSSSLSSPAYGGRPSSRSGPGGYRSGSCSTPHKAVAFGGSILAPNATAQRFVDYAHTRHLNTHYRLRLAAHVHWSAQRLQSAHPISPGFEKLFGLICRLIGESSVPLRTKALRCLASTVELDPNLFAGSANKPSSEPCDSVTRTAVWLRDLPRMVHARLLDNSTAVREAAVDLVSRLLLVRPRLLSEYYPMLAERVLDKGVSVRKRAIRCFRDLLLVNWDGEQPESAQRRARYKEGVLLTRHHGVEMCLKLIRRLHDDEESIQKLVIELFHNIWFTPIPSSNIMASKLLDRRITNLSGVVSVLRSGSFDVLETFLKQILTTSDPIKAELLDSACIQLVDRLLVLVKRLSSSPNSTTKDSKHKKLPQSSTYTILPPPTLQCLLATLHLISRCKPNLFRGHCKFFIDLLHRSPTATSNNSTVSSGSQPTISSVEPCVSSSGTSSMDVQSLFHLVSVIEMTLISFSPGTKTDSSFTDLDLPEGITLNNLHDLERDLIRLIQRQGRVVVDSSLSCLATLANRVLKDHAQVTVCFGQFYGLLTNLSFSLRKALSTKVTSTASISSRTRPSVLRALYTVGLMCKHFEIDDLMATANRVPTSTPNVLDEVVDTLMLFAEYAAAPVPATTTSDETATKRTAQYTMNDPDLCRKAVMGLGFVMFRHDQLLCTKRVRTFLSRFFTMDQPSLPSVSTVKSSTFYEMQCIVLDNLTHYLVETERQMVADNRLWYSVHKTESLKELSDGRSGHGSAVAQDYLPMVLNYCTLSPSSNVRTAALGFVSVIMRQGLVQPTQALSFLICMQTDPDNSNRSRASHLLVEAERKVPGFVAIRAAVGIQMSYYMHLLLRIATSENNGRLAHIPVVRGFNTPDASCSPASIVATSTQPLALNHGVYSMLRSNRQSRRSLISNILSLFRLDQKAPESQLETTLSTMLPPLVWKHPLGQIVFLADQLTHFPYAILDEVFYVAFTVERLVSDCGPSLVRAMQQALLSSMKADQSSVRREATPTESETTLLNLLDEAETKLCSTSGRLRSTSVVDGGEEEPASAHWDEQGQLLRLFARAEPPNLRQQALESMFHTGPICFLLLAIRAHLREFYGVTDSKLKDYSPSDPVKQWDKPIQLVKRPAAGQQISTLPSFVLQCMKNPHWLALTDLPSDAFVLTHFIRLRYQLLALEGGQSEELDSAETGVVGSSGADSTLSSSLPTKSEQLPTTSKHSARHKAELEDAGSPSKVLVSEAVSSTVPPTLQPEGLPSNEKRRKPSPPSKVGANAYPPKPTPVSAGTKVHNEKWSSSSHPTAGKKRKARSPSTSSLDSSTSSSSIPVRKNVMARKESVRSSFSSKQDITASSSHQRKAKAHSTNPDRSNVESSGRNHHSEQKHNERPVSRPTSRRLSSSSDLDSEASPTRNFPVSSDSKRKPHSSLHHSRKDDNKPSKRSDNICPRIPNSINDCSTKVRKKHGERPHTNTQLVERQPESKKSKVADLKSKSQSGSEQTAHCAQSKPHSVGASSAVRSLAPLPEAMMHSSHVHRSGQPKPTMNKAKPKSLSHTSRNAAPEPTKPSGKLHGSQVASSSARVSADRSAHHHLSSKVHRDKKPQTVHRLSGSSSLSSEESEEGRRSPSSSSVSSVSTPSDCTSLSSSSSSAAASPPAKPKKPRKVPR